MSNVNEQSKEVTLMEFQARIQRAELAKTDIAIRIKKREFEIKRDQEHLFLQDKVIEEVNKEMENFKRAHKLI